jgi:hypothetical protein
MRSAFGVWRSEFGGIGIAPGENDYSDDDSNNYHSKIARQRGNHQPLNAERQTPDAAR